MQQRQRAADGAAIIAAPAARCFHATVAPAAGGELQYRSRRDGGAAAAAGARGRGGQTVSISRAEDVLSTLNAAAEAKDWKLIVDTIEDAMDNGVRPTPVMYATAITSLARLGCTYPLKRIYGQMQSFGFELRLNSLNHVLVAFARVGDAPAVHAIAADINSLREPAGDDTFKRLVFAYFCVDSLERAYKILDLYRSMGGPVGYILGYAVAEFCRMSSPQQFHRNASLLRALVTYIALTPASSTGEVEVVLRSIILTGDRDLLLEALVQRRVVEMAPLDVLEEALLMVARHEEMHASAKRGAIHLQHSRLTLEEFAEGASLSRPELEARQRRVLGIPGLTGRAEVEDEEMEASSPAHCSSAPLVFSWPKLLQRGSSGAEFTALHPHSHHERAADAAAAYSSHPFADPLAWTQHSRSFSHISSRGGSPTPAAASATTPAAETTRPPPAADESCSSSPQAFSAESLFNSVLLQTSLSASVDGGGADLPPLTCVDGAVMAGGGGSMWHGAAPASRYFPRDSSSSTLAALPPLFVGPLLGGLDSSNAFAGWRHAAVLTVEERNDRRLRFAAGLLLHLEAMGHVPLDVTYRSLFAALALHGKAQAAAQVASRLHSRSLKLTDTLGVDSLLMSLQSTGMPPSVLRGLYVDLLSPLLIPELVVAYDLFCSKHRPALASIVCGHPWPANPRDPAIPLRAIYRVVTIKTESLKRYYFEPVRHLFVRGEERAMSVGEVRSMRRSEGRDTDTAVPILGDILFGTFARGISEDVARFVNKVATVKKWYRCSCTTEKYRNDHRPPYAVFPVGQEVDNVRGRPRMT